MCQWCGSFTHPSEFCKDYGADDFDIQQFQKMGSFNGEHAEISGYIVVANIGCKVALSLTLRTYEAQMVKLLPEIEPRNELVYFWEDDVFLTSHVNSIKDTTESPISHKKSFITDFSITPHPESKETFDVFYFTTKIRNPHKLFFPLDIRDPNCWFPICKQVKLSSILYTNEFTINDSVILSEEFSHDDSIEEFEEKQEPSLEETKTSD